MIQLITYSIANEREPDGQPGFLKALIDDNWWKAVPFFLELQRQRDVDSYQDKCQNDELLQQIDNFAVVPIYANQQ